MMQIRTVMLPMGNFQSTLSGLRVPTCCCPDDQPMTECNGNHPSELKTSFKGGRYHEPTKDGAGIKQWPAS